MKLKKGKLAAFFGFKSQTQEESLDQKDSPVIDELADLQVSLEHAVTVDPETTAIKVSEEEDPQQFVEQPTEFEKEKENKSVEVEKKTAIDKAFETQTASAEIEMATQELAMDYEHEEHLLVNYSKEQLALSENKLDEFMRVCPGAYGVLISTVDGHELLYLLKRDIPVHKISTMNSSLLALGESIARESSQKLCQFVILENSDGRVVSLRVNDILMLTCISSKDTNLGMLLSVGRNTASDLMQILS